MSVEIMIDELTFNSGEKKQVLFHPYGMPVDLPTTVICGKTPGISG